ncbi:MAG: Ku protein [Polyangiaceae bacterium]
MARPVWSGTVGFGLVQIPVTLHSGKEKDELDLRMLDRRNFSPIGYERINKATGEQVPWNEVVKGHEVGDGNYVILSDADLKRANIESTRQIDISAFVDFKSIDPRYIDRPYYVAPQKFGTKAYAVLREALKRTGKAGIGKVVLRTRQHLAAIVAHEKTLLLVLLRFSDELRDESDLDLPDLDLKKLGISIKELNMAERLIDGMAEEFRPDQYRDEYRDDLMALIQARAEAGETNRIAEGSDEPAPEPHGAKIIDSCEAPCRECWNRHSPSLHQDRQDGVVGEVRRRSGASKSADAPTSSGNDTT